MKVLYFDCFSGISGDMTLGALLDLGIEEALLKDKLKLLKLEGYEIKTEKKLKNGIMGTELTVLLKDDKHEHDHDHGHNHVHHHEHEVHKGHHHEHIHHHHAHEHRSYRDILKLIEDSELNMNIKALSKKIFNVIAEAEAKIHGKAVEEVHFHEVGAVDSIVDIVGAAICIDALKVEDIMFSKIPLSTGFVKCQHGIFPVPAPATMEILKGVPVYYNNAGFELVTPTGAAIVKALGTDFGMPEDVEIESIGYGLGKKTYEVPNVLRAIIFNTVKKNSEKVVQINTNIDDMTGEQLGFLMEKLMQEGALDAYFTGISMKKNRPAVMLSVLCSCDKKEYFTSLLLKYSSTFGVRYSYMEREVLARKTISIDTEYGCMRVKLGLLNGEVVKFAPEYEDCRAAAIKYDKPVQHIYEAVIHELMKKKEVLHFSIF
ncbi:MAG: nickel pincer cofactor biosynthesis protein LarC [Bacillota bacterium]